MILLTASWLMATRSKLMLNLAPRLLAPLTMSVVSWRTRNKTQNSRKWIKNQEIKTKLPTWQRLQRAQNPACEDQEDRMFPTSGRLSIETRSKSLRSCTKDWYSALLATTVDPRTHPTPSSHLKAGRTNDKGHSFPLKYNLRTKATQPMPIILSGRNRW